MPRFVIVTLDSNLHFQLMFEFYIFFRQWRPSTMHFGGVKLSVPFPTYWLCMSSGQVSQLHSNLRFQLMFEFYIFFQQWRFLNNALLRV